MGDIYKKILENLIAPTGIKINGNNPWDIQVKNNKFYRRVILKGSLGFGESYMDGWWESKDIDQTVYKILKQDLDKKVTGLKEILLKITSKISNFQRRSKVFEVGKVHYDLGNDLYESMLDKRMNYSCGYWKNAKNLDEAQEAKLELICQKIGLEKGMNVLDIGCGWGGFLKYASEKYNVKGTGITISKEQAKYAKESFNNLPIEIKLQDYRKDLHEKFDRIISIGMVEHVGKKNYKTFMKVAHKNLKDDGLFLLHTIGGNTSVSANDTWTEKYIFPNSMLPSIKQLGKSIEGLFVMEDLHNFGANYDKTLMAWYKNFSSNWEKIKNNYDKGDDGERFKRMWTYYLLSCAGSFRARKNQVWQMVLSKNGVENGYQRII